MSNTFKRLPIIRHVRFFWHKWRMIQHYERMRPLFPLAGPQQFEIDYLNKIWRGSE